MNFDSQQFYTKCYLSVSRTFLVVSQKIEKQEVLIFKSLIIKRPETKTFKPKNYQISFNPDLHRSKHISLNPKKYRNKNLPNSQQVVQNHKSKKEPQNCSLEINPRKLTFTIQTDCLL